MIVFGYEKTSWRQNERILSFFRLQTLGLTEQNQDSRQEKPQQWACWMSRLPSQQMQLVLSQHFSVAHLLRHACVFSHLLVIHAVDQKEALWLPRAAGCGASRVLPGVLGVMGHHWALQKILGVKSDAVHVLCCGIDSRISKHWGKKTQEGVYF